MSPTPEQQAEIECFPAVLKALLAAELIAGNAVIEIGHSFPAPPAGAYLKLADKVSTRPRASGDGLDFHERSNSTCSGVFTDEKRFHFILEPPDPPPPYPDMDAIRTAMQEAYAAANQLALRRAEAAGADEGSQGRRPGPASADDRPPGDPSRWWSCTERAAGVQRVLHFRDPRPPHAIQFALERHLMVLFKPTMDHDRLTLRTCAGLVGAAYTFELVFEAALTRENCYSLRVETSWDKQAVTYHDYYRKTAESWFRSWTRGFTGAPPPAADEGLPARYHELCGDSLKVNAHPGTIPELQQAIVAAMKQGACFITSNKEGDTRLSWRDGNFFRIDTGEYPAHRKFSSEDEFLTSLRQFYDLETSQNIHPEKASDLDAWKLILRLLGIF